MNASMHRVTLRVAGLALGAGVLLAGSACSTDLKETPTNFVSPAQFYQNDAQAQIAVNGVFAPLMDWNGWRQPAEHSIMCDDDEMNCESWMGGGPNGQIQGQWYAEGNSVWFGDYQMIERANEVIKYVGGSAGVTAAGKTKAIAQAKFGRAYAYFDLARRFGGVPLRLEAYQPDVQLGALPRSSLDSVYSVITKDLVDAANGLPAAFDPSNAAAMPRAASAWGLLSKVYMHMAGAEVKGTSMEAKRSVYLDSAIIAANKVASVGGTTLSGQYMDLFDVSKQSNQSEILFAVQGSRDGGSNVPPMFSPAGDCTLVGGCGPAGPGFVTVRFDFARSFAPGDKRAEPNVAMPRTWLAMPQSQSSFQGKTRAVIHRDSLKVLLASGLVTDTTLVSGDGWTQECEINRLWPGFYRVTHSASQGAPAVTDTIALPYAYYTLKYIDRGNNGSQYGNKNNFIVLRYADVLLLLAEAENEKNGPTSAAYTAINAVRARAGLSPLAGLSQADFRSAVRQERRWELYGEFQRTFDLRRYGTYVSEMNKPASAGVPGLYSNTVCRPRQAFQVLEPIPGGELAANPLMTQNPGY